MAGKGRLIKHFEGLADKLQESRWDELWKSGEQDLWDRGQASVALEDYITSASSVFSPMGNSDDHLRALVPGCGTGYDPTMLAVKGFEAEGLEVSNQAVNAANAFARTQIEVGSPTPSNGVFHFASGGTVEFLSGNFFDTDWERHDGTKRTGQYDLIYDYTFLCALPPSLRKAWADRMSELLKPSGYLICLEFPLWKDASLPGPPWGMKGVYWDLLSEGGDGLLQGGSEQAKPTSCNGHFERVQYFAPARSFEQGRGADMMSVWRRK